MKLKAHITEQEFEMIKEAIKSTLKLSQYDFIEARSVTKHAISMHKDIFFESLKSNFVIIK